MPHTIFKYPFSIGDRFVMTLPVNSEIVKVSSQNGIPTMWCIHTTNTEVVEPRIFRIYRTGREIHDFESLTYISTFELNRFVWHLFEESGHGTTYIEDILQISTEQPSE